MLTVCALFKTRSYFFFVKGRRGKGCGEGSMCLVEGRRPRRGGRGGVVVR